MNAQRVVQQLASLADETRTRLLLVLERHELTVSELCAVLQMPQSTVSRHLRLLMGEGWLVSRAEGTSRYYRLASGLDVGARGLWEVVRNAVAGTSEAVQDVERAREVLQRRRSRSQAFFSTAADRWDSVRAELFGENPELVALLALLDPSLEVADLGCGTGGVAALVARFAGRVVAIDESPAMLEAARRRLEQLPGTGEEVQLLEGRLEALPLESASVDAALLVLVLHYVAQPERALSEASRVLRPGGRLLVVDMVRHGRSEYAEQMGHVWPGFEREQMEEWLGEVGFVGHRNHPLPPAPGAKGPLLFAAAASKPVDTARAGSDNLLQERE